MNSYSRKGIFLKQTCSQLCLIQKMFSVNSYRYFTKFNETYLKYLLYYVVISTYTHICIFRFFYGFLNLFS